LLTILEILGQSKIKVVQFSTFMKISWNVLWTTLVISKRLKVVVLISKYRDALNFPSWNKSKVEAILHGETIGTTMMEDMEGVAEVAEATNLEDRDQEVIEEVVGGKTNLEVTEVLMVVVGVKVREVMAGEMMTVVRKDNLTTSISQVKSPVTLTLIHHHKNLQAQ
jgi:hypothetical protein